MPLIHLRTGLEKLRSLIPIYGFFGAITIVSKNIFLLEKVYRLEKDLEIQDVLVTPKIPITIQVISKYIDLDKWEFHKKILNIRGHYGLSQFSKRLKQNDILFYALWENHFVGFVWLGFSPENVVGYALREDEAYTYDGWTFEEYRGKRILPCLQQRIFMYIRNNHPEIRTVVTHVASWNKPSIKGDSRAGYMKKYLELSLVIFGYHRKFRLRNDNLV